MYKLNTGVLLIIVQVAKTQPKKSLPPTVVPILTRLGWQVIFHMEKQVFHNHGWLDSSLPETDKVLSFKRNINSYVWG